MRGEAQKQEANEAGGMSDRSNITDTLICLCVIETSFSEKVVMRIPLFSLKLKAYRRKKSFNLPANQRVSWNFKSTQQTQIVAEYMNLSLQEGEDRQTG